MNKISFIRISAEIKIISIGEDQLSFGHLKFRTHTVKILNYNEKLLRSTQD